MPKSSITKGTKKRVAVKTLPAKAKTLMAKQVKKVKGGTDATAKQIKVKGESQGWVVEDFGEFPAR